MNMNLFSSCEGVYGYPMNPSQSATTDGWTCQPQSTLRRRPLALVVRVVSVALVVMSVSRRAVRQARHVSSRHDFSLCLNACRDVTWCDEPSGIWAIANSSSDVCPSSASFCRHCCNNTEEILLVTSASPCFCLRASFSQWFPANRQLLCSVELLV